MTLPLTNTTDGYRRIAADQRRARTRRPLLGRSWPTRLELRVRAGRLAREEPADA